MEDILPDISIPLDVAQKEFLDRITMIVTQSDELTSEPGDFMGAVNLTGIEIKPKNSKRTQAQVLLDPDTPGTARIEMYPDTGNNDPTYEQYVAATRQLFDPLLESYNQQYQAELRLEIQSKEDTEPKLPPTVQPSFDLFVKAANKGMLHSLDWGRWYRFVRLSALEEVALGEDEIHRLLVQRGFSEERATEIANVYRHGRALLAQEQGMAQY